ncbi:MAG: hypothetical protein HYY30_15160 [Chloroflexi bacterium]|nr:hypothetical protein [Chloroflexota bacterium]
MGKKTADIEREIEYLRADTDRVLNELERRVRETMNVRAQAEHHPLATTAIALGAITGLALVFYMAYFRPRLH